LPESTSCGISPSTPVCGQVVVHITKDGNLYTGQNPASAAALAQRLVLDVHDAALGDRVAS
jgi:hypothetical protein